MRKMSLFPHNVAVQINDSIDRLCRGNGRPELNLVGCNYPNHVRHYGKREAARRSCRFHRTRLTWRRGTSRISSGAKKARTPDKKLLNSSDPFIMKIIYLDQYHDNLRDPWEDQYFSQVRTIMIPTPAGFHAGGCPVLRGSHQLQHRIPATVVISPEHELPRRARLMGNNDKNTTSICFIATTYTWKQSSRTHLLVSNRA
ncbi:hypothetical protein V8F33_010977 [Rhypophila sp. PSN 637]